MSQHTSNKGGGKARERQRRRRERQMASRTGSGARRSTPARQTAPADRIKLPTIKLPQNRWFYLIPAAVLVFIGVIVLLNVLSSDEPEAFPNAIWLDNRWTYTERSDDDLQGLVATLRDHRIGIIYAFVSSLDPQGQWSGDVTQRNRFSEVEAPVTDFVTRLSELYPEAEVYGWVEVRADLGEEGYRLDSPQVQQTVSTFSERIVSELGFDGVFLDVKPLWTENDDLVTLLRATRRLIGSETPLAVAIAPDLTPENAGLQPVTQIAPGTMWDKEYKQRLALQADQLVVTAYHSYRDNPLDYINWVQYQVESYALALQEIEADADLIISIPNYTESLPAHNASIESIPAALDGINLAIENIGGEISPVSGVAIYSDRELDPDQWTIFRQKWLEN